MTASLPANYFEALYERERDPWRFETSFYERAKYDATLDALPKARYRSGLEIGCSIGVLTERLAGRCERLIATDPASQALGNARARCRNLPHVCFVLGRVPQDWPTGRFDLILLSEVVYYLDRDDTRRLADRVAGCIEYYGHIELVHWTGATDYPLSGDEAAELFIAALGDRAHLTLQRRTRHYRLDLLVAD